MKTSHIRQSVLLKKPINKVSVLQTLKDIGASYTLVLKSTELMEHSKFEQSFKNGIKLQFQAIIKTT